MMIPKFAKLSGLAKLGGNAGKKLIESEYLLPAVYFTGAAGGLAYGVYALVGHIRDRRPGTSAADVAKIGVPVVVGSGLAFLGWRDLRAGRPTKAASATDGGARRGRGSRRGVGVVKASGRGRRAVATAAVKSAER